MLRILILGLLFSPFYIQAASFDSPQDILKDVSQVKAYIEDPEGFNYEDCPAFLSEIYSQLTKMNPNNFKLETVHQRPLEIIKAIFETRMALRERLKSLPLRKGGPEEDPCVSKSRDFFRLGRFVEDFIGENALGVAPYDKDKDPKAIGTLTSSDPRGLLSLNPKYSKVTLRSGDLIVSRGTAFTSAAIARITQVDSQFSHVAMIYIVGGHGGKEYTIEQALKNQNVLVLEAHIEVGATVRTFKEYVADGNGRNILLRYPDPEVAHRAAILMYHKFKVYNSTSYAHRKYIEYFMSKDNPDFSIPYNFSMDLNRRDSMFCSQVPYEGFLTQGVKLPLYPSLLKTAQENDLIRLLNIKVDSTFAPGDLELDTRFDFIAEWRDIRKLQDIRYRDAILVSFFKWMKDYNYKFHPRWYVVAGSKVALLARQMDLPYITKIMSKNMDAQTTAAIVTLEGLGNKMVERLKKNEAKTRIQQGGLPLTMKQMITVLDQYRIEDRNKQRLLQDSDFHDLFGP